MSHLATLASVLAAYLAGVATATPALIVHNRRLRIARHQANTDPLTGLPNRRAAATWLRHRIDQGQALTVALLDLDNFKAVNDRFGHAAGDHLLRVIATRLWLAASPDTLVARLGGDEFLLAQTHPEAIDPAGIIHGLIALLEAPVPIRGGVHVWPHASAGITTVASSSLRRPRRRRAAAQADGVGIWSQPLARADAALHRAKRTTARVAVYDATIDGAVDPSTDRPPVRRRDHDQTT